MPLSSKIIRSLEKADGSVVLELRHRFITEEIKVDFHESDGQSADQDLSMLAEQVILEAEERAQKILSEAMSAALETEEKSKQKALQEAERLMKEARNEGYNQGIKEAMTEAAAEALNIREQARLVLRQAEEIHRQTLESMESEIVNLAVEIAEKVLSVKLELHPQVVAELAGKALGMLHDREKVFLLVNPSEHDIYEDRRDELIKHLTPGGLLDIISDPGIIPGGFIVETEYGRLDAGLDTRWENLLKALEELKK